MEPWRPYEVVIDLPYEQIMDLPTNYECKFITEMFWIEQKINSLVKGA